MSKRIFIVVVLAAFAVCAVAVAQQRKVVDEARFGTVEVKRTHSHIIKPARTLVVPWHINYQGYLTDDAGNPINDTLSMTFGIWDDPGVGSELWNENGNVVVEEGLFNVVLGSTTPIPSNVFGAGLSRWLELTVVAQTLSPRTEITSVGYAYRSVKADSADDAGMVDGFDASATPGAGDLFPLSAGDVQYVNEGQTDAITSDMILDGTVVRGDAEAAFKAPYADTADYALAANVGYVDSAGVSANSWRLEANTLTDLDSRWVNEGQADAVTSPMIVDSTIQRADVEAAFKAPYADTADYAFAAPVGSDGDWTISGSNMYSAVSGSVGIGTSTPSVKLDVDGNFVVSGYAGVGGDAAIVGEAYLYGGIYLDSTFRVSGDPGTSGQLLQSTGVGVDWVDQSSIADNDWTITGSVLYPSADYGLAMRSSNVLYGTNDSTHVNLGVACTTGTSGENYKYCTVSGGIENTASNRYATVGGGYWNTASNLYATVGGGWGNTASNSYATVGGGEVNTASGLNATVGGGYLNTASGLIATVGGGYENTASGWIATVGGGGADTSAGDYSFTVGGNSVVPAAFFNSAAFNGQTATASGQTRVGTLSKASGTFTIDHPLEPTRKILNHYFVESPEMVLIYRGVSHIGGDGRVEVHLPNYFDALNRNPMVQLTGVGTYEVFIAERVKDNRFVIGGKPGTEVHWTVTAERKDQSAEITRIIMPVEQAKDGDLAGRSLDDDFLVTTKAQLEQMGQAGQFQFRTQRGRQKYENSRRALENR